MNEQKLNEVLSRITPTDKAWAAKAQAHTADLILPLRALGELHEIAEKIAAIQQSMSPNISRKAIYTMAGDHGVAGAGVSAYPQEVTGAMVMSFLNNQAGINVLSRHAGVELYVADVGVIPKIDPTGTPNADHFSDCKIAKGTQDMTKGPAMTREQAVTSLLTGFELASKVLADGVQVIGTGDMGIGNTTPSAAIGTVFTGRSVAEMTGSGTGLNPAGVLHKQAMIQQALEVNRPDAADGVDVLAKVGGFEIGAIAGIILAAGYHKKAVAVDGFISTAGALVAHALCPRVTDYMFAAHQSPEGGHKYMWDYLGLNPLLSLGMRLGEGTGAALAMHVMEGAVKIFNEMATFSEAGVPNKE